MSLLLKLSKFCIRNLEVLPCNITELTEKKLKGTHRFDFLDNADRIRMI